MGPWVPSLPAFLGKEKTKEQTDSAKDGLRVGVGALGPWAPLTHCWLIDGYWQGCQWVRKKERRKEGGSNFEVGVRPLNSTKSARRNFGYREPARGISAAIWAPERKERDEDLRTGCLCFFCRSVAARRQNKAERYNCLTTQNRPLTRTLHTPDDKHHN